ncbi:uncharacterized protein LOC144180015 [Haemaphysalis longicornis]
MFLKEKKARDTEELVQRADDYVMAWNLNNFGREEQKREDPTVGRITDPVSATATQIQSVWTRARKASRHLGITRTLLADGASIEYDNLSLTPRHRRKLLQTLRLKQMSARDSSLQETPKQGTVMECVAAGPSSSHFMRSKKYTRFTDWHFVHRARLNLLPLNGARPWAPAADQRCRRCGHTQETLPHVLRHCMVQIRALTEQYDGIPQRVKKAAAGQMTVVHNNRPVRHRTLRPDLMLVREEAIILDVCIPFENCLIEKYKPVKNYLMQRHQRGTADAIVVGALGSWGRANGKILQRLCSRWYLRSMKKLVVSVTSAASRDIYTTHTAGSAS